jgi:hypothetical protein
VFIIAVRSKFNIDQSKKGKKKRTLNGFTFDSDIEFKFYEYLLSQQEEGIVKSIEIQPKYLLQEAYKKYDKNIRKIEYIADFLVKYSDGSEIIYDVKGMVLNDFKLKRKIFDYVYPDKILRCVNWSRLDGGWVDIEVIDKGRKERKKVKTKQL